jgi:hypothetical protein
MVVDRFGVVDPGGVAGNGDPGFRQGDRVEGIDDIGRGQRIAIMEFDAGTQHEFQRLVVNPLPRLSEQGLQLQGLRIALQQRIKGVVSDDQASARAVEIRIDIGQRITPDNTQRVGRSLCMGWILQNVKSGAAAKQPQNSSPPPLAGGG